MRDEFDIDVLENLSDYFIKFRVSKTRKGRKGIEAILTSALNERETWYNSLKDKVGTWAGR